MNRDLSLLRSEARRRYQRGQLGVALFSTWPLLPLFGAAWWLGCGANCLLLIGALLALASVTFGWRGGAYRRAVTPGLMAGAMPALLPLYSHTCAVACNSSCNDSSWTSVCMIACWGGGLAAGIAMGIFAARERDASWPARVSGGVLVVLAGSLGCWVGGVPGIVGMCLALLASAPPARVLAVRWGRQV